MEGLKSFIHTEARRLGFQKVGFAEAAALEWEGGHQRSWLDEGRHGSMSWLARRLGERTDPRQYYPPVKTVVSLAMNYYTPGSRRNAPLWSRYAGGDDYHRLLKKRLKTLLGEITAAYPQVNGITCVDTSPVMEKIWAQRAELGWQGKHTVLITREYGSWVFLGELLLDAALEPDQPFEENLCGDCTACLEACPTGALTGPYRIDASRCISYLTVEHKEPFSQEEAGMLNGWLYGCDLCQEACPWNTRLARPTAETAFTPREFTAFDWEDWAGLSRERWDELLKGSAARRIGYEQLMRNIQTRTELNNTALRR